MEHRPGAPSMSQMTAQQALATAAASNNFHPSLAAHTNPFLMSNFMHVPHLAGQNMPSTSNYMNPAMQAQLMGLPAQPDFSSLNDMLNSAGPFSYMDVSNPMLNLGFHHQQQMQLLQQQQQQHTLHQQALQKAPLQHPTVTSISPRMLPSACAMQQSQTPAIHNQNLTGSHHYSSLSQVTSDHVVPLPPVVTTHHQRSSHNNTHNNTSVSIPAPVPAPVPPPRDPNHIDAALEEALKSFSNECTLDNLGDIGDLNEHLLQDTFFGAPGTSGSVDTESTKLTTPSQPATVTTASGVVIGQGDVFHSILDYDPNTLNAQSSSVNNIDINHETNTGEIEEPQKSVPPVESQPSAPLDSSVVPKLREKFKRREKEFAEIDKAFDRHMSLVAIKNASACVSLSSISLPAVPTITNAFDAQDSCDMNSAASTSAMSPVRFSPVHFSPPRSDSPAQRTNNNPLLSVLESLNSSTNKPKPTSKKNELKVFIPVPEEKNKNVRKNKVPIYKQAAMLASLKTEIPQANLDESGGTPRSEISVPSSLRSPDLLGPSSSHCKDMSIPDEYCFTEDEQMETSTTSINILDSSSEQKVEEEVARKLMNISSLHPDQLKLSPNPQSSSNSILQPTPRNVPCTSQDTTCSRKGRRGGKGVKGQEGKNDDLWKHVVPKKRHSTSNNVDGSCGSVRPSAPLLPPEALANESMPSPALSNRSAEDFKPTQPLTVAQQLAECLRRRRERQRQNCFVQTEIVPDCHTALPDCPGPTIELRPAIKPDNEGGGEPLPPKVIIRIPRACIKLEPEPVLEEENWTKHKKKHKKHKKHKRKKSKEDPDYLVGVAAVDAKKIKKLKKVEKAMKKERKEKRSSLSESDYEEKRAHVSDTQVATPIASGTHYSKKQRLMEGWTGDQDNEPLSMKDNWRRNSNTIPLTNPEFAAEADQRLSQFKQATGPLQKGSFIVMKEEIGKIDCPIWKVDNQNLLQKFLPYTEPSGNIIYKSSSTYSGWATQNSDQYMMVRVRYIKNKRSDSIVEPETPLLDLFPAVSTEITDNGGIGNAELLFGGSLSPPECDQHMSNVAPPTDHPLKEALNTYIHALILHTISGNFMQNMQPERDRKFYRHVKEADSYNFEKKAQLLQKADWGKDFQELVEWYPLCTIVHDPEIVSFRCQACDKEPVSRVIQLFANECYDFDTLESKPPRMSGSGSPLPSHETLACSKCSQLAATYHKLVHMRYHLYKKCEDKVDCVREDHPNAEPMHIIDSCLKNKQWISQLTQDYVDHWRSIKQQ